MRLQVRICRPSDREAVAALLAAAYPGGAGELARWDDQFRRWVAADGDRVVGYGSLWPARDHRFRIDLAVAPEHRRHGIGGRLLGVLAEAAQAAGAATVQARTESDRLQVLAFLSRRGLPKPCACTVSSWRWRTRRSSRTPTSSRGSPRRASR